MNKYLRLLAPIGVFILTVIIAGVIMIPVVITSLPMYSFIELIPLLVLLLPVFYTVAFVVGPLFALSLDMFEDEAV